MLLAQCLRATMDEDLSNNAETPKAHRALLQALHETQQEHTSTLAQHTATLARPKSVNSPSSPRSSLPPEST
jgi:hypothetical protein